MFTFNAVHFGDRAWGGLFCFPAWTILREKLLQRLYGNLHGGIGNFNVVATANA